MFTPKFETRSSGSRAGARARRAAMAAGLIGALPTAIAAAPTAEDQVVRDLVSRSEQQARLFNAGEMDRWLDVADPGDEFTLMQPFGGPASLGFDRSESHLAQLADSFRNGDAGLELVQTVASDDVVVLVYVERQEMEVLGLPKQDWSLRVTQVFQRQGPDWKLVHRHADPLVRPIPLDVAAALAAGRGLAAEPGRGR